MGIAERKEREKEQRRNDIVDAAEKVFFSKGMRDATMDEVAEAAELSKGTLYLYFKSKEDLYLAINARGLRLLDKMFRDAVAKKKKGIDKVAAIGKAYNEFFEKHSDYFNAMIYYESHAVDFEKNETCANECHNQGEDALKVVVEALKIGISDGTIREDIDPFKTAVILWGQSTGIIQILSLKGRHLAEEHGFDLENIMDHFSEMVRCSLTK